jgi:transcriptional regulator with XRE-family HTH domain
MPIDNDPRAPLVRELDRCRNGMSQRQLADKVGRSQPSVRDWLIGKTLPDHESIRRIVAAFPDLYPYAVDVITTRKEPVA